MINALKIDLVKDYEEMLNMNMISMGYDIKPNGYSSTDYHKAMKKLISSVPRTIYYSEEFSCPKAYKEALSKLENSIKKGENLIPYMSKRVMDPGFNDGLLNDWGIHHFHLNVKKEEDSIFIKRSDWLLLAYINEQSAYFIGVYPHRKPHLWSHINLVEIMDKNWPEVIEKYKLEGFLKLDTKLDDKSYAKLRRSNLLTLVEVGEGKVYGMIGGGYASNGSSIEAVRTSDYWVNYLRKIEILIERELYNFKQQMLVFDSKSMKKKMNIRLLKLDRKDLILLEIERNIIIEIKPETGKIRINSLKGLLENYIYEGPKFSKV